MKPFLHVKISRAASILGLFLSIWLDIALSAKCMLPASDDRPEGTSKYNLEGTIFLVNKDVIDIQPRDPKKKLISVRLSTKTDLFTVYGGFIRPGQLLSGIKVQVWFNNCVAPKKGIPAAAVIIIASEKPGEDFP